MHSINGADGLAIDAADNCGSRPIRPTRSSCVDPTGRVIAKLGDFDGIDRHGAPVGLMFPASLVRVDDFIYVTNLALDLRNFGLPQTVDSQWTAASHATHDRAYQCASAAGARPVTSAAHSAALARLLAHPAIWRGGDCASEPAALHPALPSSTPRFPAAAGRAAR